MSTTVEERQVEAIAAQNNLTQAVATWQSGIATERAQEKENFEAWKGSLEVESRVVQDITIAGSSDYLYPVWWVFPDNSFGIGELIISRSDHWNHPNGVYGDVNVNPIDFGTGPVGSLLLQLRGNGNYWSADAVFMEVVRFIEKRTAFASHIQIGHHSFREGIDGGEPDYGADGLNYIYSGLFLRGGNITYRFISNWRIGLNYQNGSGGVNHKSTIHEYLNTRFFTKPMPLSQRAQPVVS